MTVEEIYQDGSKCEDCPYKVEHQESERLDGKMTIHWNERGCKVLENGLAEYMCPVKEYKRSA